jgi:hypothetical protein
VNNKVRFAVAEKDEKSWLEIFAKDYLGDTVFGQPGDELQILIDGTEVPLTGIYELDPGVKIWPLL